MFNHTDSAEQGRRNRNLIAYAFLAQTSRNPDDLLQGLMPIFKPIAKLYSGDRFDPVAFSRTVGDIYGLKVSNWAVEDLAPRLEKAGLLVRSQLSEGVVEYVYADIKEEFSEVTEGDIELVIIRFIEFATPILEQHGEKVDNKKLEDALFNQLIKMEFIGILLKPDRVSNLKAGPNTITLAKAGEQKTRERENEELSRLDVLCASFILDIFHKDPNLYALILRLATGALISEVILNFQDPGNTLSLKGLTIVLDTPFLMSVLDVSDEQSHFVACSICEQLREKGARLEVFDHSIQELTDILRAVLSSVQAGTGYGATARRLSNPMFHKYVTGVCSNPYVRIKQDSIQVINPPKTIAYYQYFSKDDEDAFEKSLGYFENRLAQSRDAASIAAVIRLRKNTRAKMGRFSTIGYLFLTSNSWIAKQSRNYMVRSHLYSEDEVPPAVSDRYLAGLLWVLYGGKTQDLPHHVLLANCAAAVEPRSDVITQMHNFLQRVDSKKAEYFNALMTEERAGQYLMQLTLGEPSFLTLDNAPIVLEQMKRSLIEKQEVERQREMEALRVDHASQIGRERSTIDGLRQDVHDARTKEFQLEGMLRDVRGQVSDLESSIKDIYANKIYSERRQAIIFLNSALRLVNIIHGFLALIFAGLSVLGTWIGMQTSDDLHKISALLIAFFVALLSFWKIPDLIFNRFLIQFRNSLYTKKLTKFGLDPDKDHLAVDWKSGKLRELKYIPSKEA